MAWIGWQPGMSGLPIQNAKKLLRRKFSYASLLDDSPFYNPELKYVLIRYQEAKNKAGFRLRTDGVLDWGTQQALGLVAPSRPSTVGTLFTVHGTGQADPFGPGYPADVARAVGDVWTWQPIGNYPASAFPMNASVEAGRAELKLQIRQRPGRIALAGYSQGAMVVSRVWMRDIADPAGELHDRMGDVVAAVTWGNPWREKGCANGNVAEGVPVPEGRGISDELVVDTPSWWLDFAHGANSRFGRDIYTDTPDDDAGEHMTAIFRFVQDVSGFIGPGGLLEQVGEMLADPSRELAAAFRAVYYGGLFVATRPFPTLPHCNYDLRPAISFLRSFKGA